MTEKQIKLTAKLSKLAEQMMAEVADAKTDDLNGIYCAGLPGWVYDALIQPELDTRF